MQGILKLNQISELFKIVQVKEGKLRYLSMLIFTQKSFKTVVFMFGLHFTSIKPFKLVN